MAWTRATLGLAATIVVGTIAVSGGSRDDSAQRSYLPKSNELRTVFVYGRARVVDTRSLGAPRGVGADPRWLAQARPLGSNAPRWARRLYRRSLLVLRAVTDRRSGAVVAGLRDGWAYVWPRDASAVAMALASAGYTSEAQRIVRFLLGLDLAAAARFRSDGAPVDGRGPEGDAAGWTAVAAKTVGLRDTNPRQAWRDRADYQERGSGDYLANAIPSGAGGAIRREFEAPNGTLVRDPGDPDSGLDSAAAWAVRPFARRPLYPDARRTLLRIAAGSSRFGILPSEDWDGGEDPWTAPTAWSAWSPGGPGWGGGGVRCGVGCTRRCAPPDGGAAP
jgi:hypothetical protein